MRDALDNSAIQAGPRGEHLCISEVFLHERGKSKADNLDVAVTMHLDHNASRGASHIENLVPSRSGTFQPYAFGAVLSQPQAQAFGMSTISRSVESLSS